MLSCLTTDNRTEKDEHNHHLVRVKFVNNTPDYFRIQYPNAKTGELREQEIDPQVKAAVLDAAQRLAGAGAEIVENVPMPNTRYGIPAYFVVARVEAAPTCTAMTGSNTGTAPRGLWPTCARCTVPRAARRSGCSPSCES